MIPKPRRPIGITLLSVAFLWIGCIGSIALPLMAVSQGSREASQILLGRWIYSPFVLHFALFFILLLWLSFYVLYAVIGHGLWKLRNWARRAVIAVSILGILLNVASLPFFLRMGIPVWSILPFLSFPYLGLIWYLRRPRILHVFGALPILPGAPPLAGPPAGLSDTGKMMVAICAVAVSGAFIVGLFRAVEQAFRDSDAYKLALAEARKSPCVVDKIGESFVAEGSISGSLEAGKDKGSADLDIPIKGPKGKGTLVVSAANSGDRWTITKLVLIRGDITSQIQPALPSGCE